MRNHLDFYETVYKGRTVRVSPEDRDLLEGTNWYWETNGYLRNRAKGCYLHQLIAERTFPQENTVKVDHRDQNKSNNVRSNLRPATQKDNSGNVHLQRNNTSGYRGVCWFKGRDKWMAKIKINGKRKTIGYFDCKHEAARAYNAAALEHFGEFAWLNPIQEEPINA